ncbi:MAG: PD40 domain-containing protein [Planctomycetes bacterium]|nr:PD40 domain-containing protein [Planctomycetota bacterium]MBI3834930.1 PD40 domain-containing protein [Planctomycetota bacterium]
MGNLICAWTAVRAGDAPPSESTYLANIKQITDTSMGFTKAGEAYFSPDGTSIIFQATPNGKEDYQIYTHSIGSHEAKMVSTGKGACTCAYYRPDGLKIIFASSHLDPGPDKPQPPKDKKNEYKWDFNSYMDIFEANPDGTELKRLTETPGYDAEGSYSHDGRLIVFTSQRDGDLEIYVMDAYGTNTRRLTSAKGYDGGPFFSPDDWTILYRGDHRDDGKMNLQLRMINLDGSNDHAITDNVIFNWCPYWHPSGQSFIFTQADHGAFARGEKPNYDLYMMKIDGSDQTRITFDPEFDGLPVFSPDGNRLMWTSKRGGLPEAQVFIADFTLPEAFK